LFTTLSTTTRLVEFSKKKFLLTDTVGFIDRLPLTLIEAFHSTLEETIYANLILLVVDASEALDVVEKKLAVCLETIDRIGASGIPIITAFNKIDLLSEAELEQKLDDLREKMQNIVPLSALRGTNLDTLRSEVLRILKSYVQASFSVPMTAQVMSFISWLFKSTDVKKTEYRGDSVSIVFEATPELAEKVRNRVEAFKGKFERHLE
jgi:GTP-binding protein HflX